MLMELEGLFRLLPKDLERKDDVLVTQIQTMAGEYDDLQSFWNACVDAAIFCKGDRKSKKVRRQASAVDDQDQAQFEDEAAPASWNIYTAQAISKVGLAMQRELFQDYTISYLIKWCATHDIRVPGMAYADVSVLYDDGDKTIRLVPPSPDNNIYLSVAFPLVDPGLEDAKAELLVFYRQTFWANLKFFRCCQAAQALAKRGLNVDRLFGGISPGGTGQSLFSTHLDAMYPGLHRFFDPSIWYHDDEIRKQIEEFVGFPIMTAQETPETKQRMREDLFKKMLSGDGIAGRMPYGKETRMIRIIGWKRIEMNRLPR